MKMVIEHRIVKNIDGHGPGELFQFVTDPRLTVSEILLGERIDSTEKGSLRAAIEAMVNAHRGGIEHFPSRRAGHFGTPDGRDQRVTYVQYLA